MRQALAVVALIAACHGGSNDPVDHANRRGSASIISASLVPKLPQSPDGAEELRAIDQRIEIHRDDPRQEIPLLLERGVYRGQLEDYQDALARSADWIAKAPTDGDAWVTREAALAAVHDFSGAREAVDHIKKLSAQRSDWEGIEVTLDEASGHRERSGPIRESVAQRNPTPANLTLWAANLAFRGKLDEAVAVIPRAAAAVHDNSPQLFAWLLFQWARLYEQKGDLTIARRFLEAAHQRMPGYLEADVHLAQTMIATGDPAGARRLVQADLAGNRHPSLLELGVQLSICTLDDARAEWERYVTALPDAFADHAARFYLGVGADPKRALELAQRNLAHRDVPEARELVVTAALAANDPAAACGAVDPLMTSPIRGQRFVAWRALSRCGRNGEAGRIAAELGIRSP